MKDVIERHLSKKTLLKASLCFNASYKSSSNYTIKKIKEVYIYQKGRIKQQGSI